MTLVLDASITIKWLVNEAGYESDTQLASHLVETILSGQEQALQPFHWLAETGAVLARLSPDTAEADLEMIQALEIPVTDHPAILRRACRLSIDLQHHLFDTLYHAVALETPDAVLITADNRYLRKARKLGRIAGLHEWPLQAE